MHSNQYDAGVAGKQSIEVLGYLASIELTDPSGKWHAGRHVASDPDHSRRDGVHDHQVSWEGFGGQDVADLYVGLPRPGMVKHRPDAGQPGNDDETEESQLLAGTKAAQRKAKEQDRGGQTRQSIATDQGGKGASQQVEREGPKAGGEQPQPEQLNRS